jgi:hypothetical protein
LSVREVACEIVCAVRAEGTANWSL